MANCGCNSIYNLAQLTWEELGSPNDVSVNFIIAWYLSDSSVGKLNNLINTCYSGVSGCISPEIGMNESAIYKEVYKINYYDKRVAQATNSALTDSWIELKDDVSTIKRHNKNEIAKTFIMQRKDSYDALKDMIFAYQQNNAQLGMINMGENNEINPYSYTDWWIAYKNRNNY